MNKQHPNNETTSPSLGDIYDGLNFDINVEVEKLPDGKHQSIIGEDFENGLKSIHEFVDRVRASEDPIAFRTTDRAGRPVAVRTRLGLIPTGALITEEFRRQRYLSEQVRVFLEAQDELRLLEEAPLQQPLSWSRLQPGKRMGDVANDFVGLIHEKASSKTFRSRLATRRFAVEENFRRGKALIDALFARHARLNVVRIDLGYLRAHKPTLEQIKQDFGHFLNNARQNSIFHSVVGFVWHLEWAFMTGFHVHLLAFLDGSKTRHDAFVTQQMGDYWKNVITKGCGRIHNCNAEKSKYKRLGIGMISHDDQAKRDVLVNVVLRYLTKVDELARPRVPKGTKTFGTSHMPDAHPGTGRKRRAAFDD
jgi:hypothetical protein